MDKRKVIYYSDELNDEFSTAEIKAKPIDENWIYCPKGSFKRFTRFFWYRIVAPPIAFFATKIAFRHKIIGKEKLKPFRKNGYFIYGNHTHALGDAGMPSMITFPKSCYCVVHANNVSMPVLGRITPSLGALPLPDGMGAYKNFNAAIEQRIAEGNAVVIYPEAHIWPYYTKIRPFTDVSFAYPVKCDCPVFCFTNTYQKRKNGKKFRIVTYVEGPFFADKELSLRNRRLDLRNKVYNAMCENAKKSDFVCIEYIKREEENG